jgi:hypothetical protein
MTQANAAPTQGAMESTRFDTPYIGGVNQRPGSREWHRCAGALP